MEARKKAYLQLHLAVFLFGFTGILGKLILLPALTLVWWRSLLSWIFMLPHLKKAGGLKSLDRRRFWIYLGIGGVVALHWICFYGSIKLSNSSVAMVCLAFIPVFTAFCESIFHWRPLRMVDVLTGCLTIPAMWLILQNIDLQYRVGFLVGVLAALLSAVFVTLNKKYIHGAGPIQISWLELFAVWLVLSVLLPFYAMSAPQAAFLPDLSSAIYLVILSYFCTALAYVMSLKALYHTSAFSAMLAFNLEPVYGILFAMALLKEHKELNPPFYLGVAILLATVFLYPMLKRRFPGKLKMADQDK
ncbi:MAG: DMT family transporter [Saprospiraceae bacterium]|nr:DMT family transporter [Saprospiraceae bacterium]